MAGFGEPETGGESAPPPAFTVYIGSLSYSTEVDGLTNFLTEHDVTPTSVRIITRDGASKGFGYADFDNEAEGKKCIALDGTELDGRTLRCNEADTKPSSAPSSTLTCYIGGLSYNTEPEGLKAFLEENGVNASDVRIISKDGKSKGFGYADFDDTAEFNKCKDLHGMTLDERELRINEADAPPRRGGRGGRNDGGYDRNDFGGGGFGGGFGGGDGGFRSGGGRAPRGGGRGGGRSGGGDFDNETPTKLLMIKNLSWNTTNEVLYEQFGEYEPTDARVCRFSDSQKSRGFAFVEFNDKETAIKARTEHNGVELDGRQVTIVFATPRNY